MTTLKLMNTSSYAVGERNIRRRLSRQCVAVCDNHLLETLYQLTSWYSLMEPCAAVRMFIHKHICFQLTRIATLNMERGRAATHQL